MGPSSASQSRLREGGRERQRQKPHSHPLSAFVALERGDGSRGLTCYSVTLGEGGEKEGKRGRKPKLAPDRFTFFVFPENKASGGWGIFGM